MASEGMGYLLRRALSAVVPVLWPSALSVRGAILRTSNRKDPSHPGPGGRAEIVARSGARLNIMDPIETLLLRARPPRLQS